MITNKFKSYEELCDYMLDMAENGFHSVAVLFYADAISLLRELMYYEDLKVNLLDIELSDYNNYTKEYYVSLSKDMYVTVEPAYVSEKYLNPEADIILLHGDVSSSILSSIDCENCHEIEILDTEDIEENNETDISDCEDIDDTEIETDADYTIETEANIELDETDEDIDDLSLEFLLHLLVLLP